MHWVTQDWDKSSEKYWLSDVVQSILVKNKYFLHSAGFGSLCSSNKVI